MTRLDRLLAALGIGSRSQVKALLRAGRVSVDGVVLRDPAAQLTGGEQLLLDGQPLDTRLSRHLMMNKPRGLLTAARDSRQPTVLSLLCEPYLSLHCMPVGRLDKDTEGLLLFTTDGQAAHRLLAPRAGVRKRYLARVTGRLTQQAVARFQEGIALSDFTALPAGLRILRAEESHSLCEVTVAEGKYHQVRRMLAACGHQVETLKRLSIGPLELDEALAPGQWRELRAAEWQALMKEAGRDG